MPRKFIKRYCPDAALIRSNRCLQIFGEHLHSPNLWHLNRLSVARGFAVGAFWAMVPFPGQMVGAVWSAIAWRAHIPISLLLVWMTNPLTIPPTFFGAYLCGSWLLGTPLVDLPESLTMEWFRESFEEIWLPLVAGSLTIGVVLAVAGYFGINALWRWHVLHRWKQRRRQ